jgi:hypothetical protein
VTLNAAYSVSIRPLEYSETHDWPVRNLLAWSLTLALHGPYRVSVEYMTPLSQCHMTKAVMRQLFILAEHEGTSLKAEVILL